MTKRLSAQERANKQAARKQQKAASKTVKTVNQPKPEDQKPPAEAALVNLCDDCAYEFGDCDGVPKFASEEDDKVVECGGFLAVQAMPTADEVAAAHDGDDKGPNEPGGAQGDGPELVHADEVEGATEEAKAEDLAAMEADLEARRKKTQRFSQEEDFGACQVCGQPLKRTALNRDRDAVRCVNGHCRQYRFILKTIPPGV